MPSWSSGGRVARRKGADRPRRRPGEFVLRRVSPLPSGYETRLPPSRRNLPDRRRRGGGGGRVGVAEAEGAGAVADGLRRRPGGGGAGTQAGVRLLRGEVVRAVPGAQVDDV